MLLSDDKMGFSFHITIVEANACLEMEYRNHLEAVFCISGSGTIHDVAKRETHEIVPGVLYALDQNDEHTLRADTELVLACVFNPPLTGVETHDENGSYPAQFEVSK